MGRLSAAETAADFDRNLQTDAPAGGEAGAAQPFEPIELENRSLLTMPGDWMMAQMHAEQIARVDLGYSPVKSLVAVC